MRALRFFIFSAKAAVLLGSYSWAQPNIIKNGDFERTLQSPNLWSGTDREGNLSGFRLALPALNRQGSISDTPMPVSVALGDLNGDGLLDIASSDPLGYIRIFFNSGTKQAPKFTLGELTLPFLTLADGVPPWSPPGIQDWEQRWSSRRQGVRIALVDTTKTGKLDMVAGNYFGDLFLIRNTGSTTVPRYEQPQPLSRAMLATTKDPSRRWGNIFAPIMHDWNEDGRLDLLVGEGSFSANNVHLLINEGSSSAPAFNDQKRQPLALGQGREQLTPSLADFNGDGKLDILVSDREGRVTVYLRPDNWKLGDVIPPNGYLAKTGGLVPTNPSDPEKEKAPAFVAGTGIHTLSAGDLNGDGLFDLVFGRSNGRIVLALNTGTKDQPKFDTPKEIVGLKPTPPSWLVPSQWDINTGFERGNYLAYATVVSNEDDPEAKTQDGNKVLKFGYAQPPKTLLARPLLNTPLNKDFNIEGRSTSGQPLLTSTSAARSLGAPVNFFTMRQTGFVLDIGKTYTLSLKVRGSKVSRANAILAWRGHKVLDEGRTVQGERGATQQVGRRSLSDSGDIVVPLSPSATWSTVTRSVKIEFQKEKDLNKEPKTSEAMIEVFFELSAPDGFLFVDDIQLTPQS